jgi:hypothetical protein
MRIAMLCLMGIMAVSGCDWARNVTSTKNRVYFEGLYFPARLSTTSSDKMAFQVTVDGVAQELAPAREAGRYQATKHCVTLFGTSDVIWSAGPDEADADLRIVEGKLFLEGRCNV